jgi:transposase-like protein
MKRVEKRKGAQHFKCRDCQSVLSLHLAAVIISPQVPFNPSSELKGMSQTAARTFPHF